MRTAAVTILGLLALAAWRDRRRDAVAARQIRLCDTIADELGAIVAPSLPSRSAVRGGSRFRCRSADPESWVASSPSHTRS